MKCIEPDWPAIIKHQDDAELSYIHDQDEWVNITKPGDCDIDETDLLLDSSGNTFMLNFFANSRIELQRYEEIQSLENILGLVKAHAAQAGSCCVAKLYAPSIKDAFNIVKSLKDS